jgi:hypothetical protein
MFAINFDLLTLDGAQLRNRHKSTFRRSSTRVHNTWTSPCERNCLSRDQIGYTAYEQPETLKICCHGPRSMAHTFDETDPITIGNVVRSSPFKAESNPLLFPFLVSRRNRSPVETGLITSRRKQHFQSGRCWNYKKAYNHIRLVLNHPLSHCCGSLQPEAMHGEYTDAPWQKLKKKVQLPMLVAKFRIFTPLGPSTRISLTIIIGHILAVEWLHNTQRQRHPTSSHCGLHLRLGKRLLSSVYIETSKVHGNGQSVWWHQSSRWQRRVFNA